MRLQLLELSGFKSFPNRAELSFEGGVTAIVGPNGCGKSNLVDAITWVLGEQSAKSLRGERMDDVIFGGSDGRRPTSAAEVRLVLKDVAFGDGTNGSGVAGTNGNGNGHGPSAMEADDEPLRRPVPRDVEVARRLYRSGESEYLIDGHVCRLRDVQDLLMNAGIGVKGYAVIEQGKIGQILSTRPNDRRQLIEEAAGVTKFKSRRHAAELKLDAAQQNLARVDDIVYELEKQRNALKRQSARARRYQRLRDELRRWETVLIGRRHRTLAATLEVTVGRLTEAHDRQAALGAAVLARDAAVASRRAALTEREAGASAAREDAHARELDVRRHQQQIAFDRQQIETLEAAEAEMVEALRALEAKRDPQQRALAAQRAAAVEADRERDAAARRLVEAEAQYEAAQRELEGLESDVEAARGEVFSAINAATALRHAVEHAVAGHERVNEDLTKLELEAADLGRELQRASSQRDEAAELLEHGRSRLADTQQALQHRQRELADARRDREAGALAVRQAEQELASTAARARSLEELATARAGYGDAARLVLSEAGSQVAHSGSVADFLEVGRAHERAVEGCLGDLLEHVIVPTRADAEAGLRLVQEHDAGRCGFLVLDGADDEGPAAAGSPPVEGLVALEDVVRFIGPHADAVRRAVGHVWIAPSLEQAAAAAPLTPSPIVTTDGVVLRGPHLVQSTGLGSARGILATKGEIRELRERLAGLEARAERAQRALQEVEQRIDAAEVASASLGAELHEQEKLIVAAELQHTRAVEEIERLTRRRTLIETDQRRAVESRRALEARQLEARASIARLETEQESADARLVAAQRRLVDARAEAERLSRVSAEEKAAHARLVERSAAGTADVSRVERAVDELETRVAERAADLQRTRDGIVALQVAIGESTRQLDEDRLALDHLGEIVQAEAERVAVLRHECDEVEAALRSERTILEDARTEVSGLEVERARIEGDIGHLADSCAQTLQLSLQEVETTLAQLERDGQVDPATATIQAGDEHEAADEADASEEVPDAEQSSSSPRPILTAEEAVIELRAKIDRLGPINMMAIEQFDELETRHLFLSEQRQDLVDSIASTGEAIKRIERTTRERFKAAFETIDRYFQETFMTMFGGGRAGLVLIDENDLLESGIDIIAQPPGKRLQSVQLLSGGEKALTAIALMFAIFRYRPSPFCLLDEIDAPLDDANIGRFVQMLRGMLSHTQFILITHNRRTMEIADRLYGVTMEEPGVSKLVSVNLN